MRFLTHPLVAPMLLSLGFLGLLIELETPTFGMAGLAGAVSLALFFGSHYLVGLAGKEELILLGVGLALLGAEIFLVPGFGLLGVGGIVAVLGSIYLSLLGSLATAADFSQAAGALSFTIMLVLVGGWLIVSIGDFEAHYVAGGRVDRVVRALISANKANIDLSFQRAAAHRPGRA